MPPIGLERTSYTQAFVRFGSKADTPQMSGMGRKRTLQIHSPISTEDESDLQQEGGDERA
jgi:hypothetical protein